MESRSQRKAATSFSGSYSEDYCDHECIEQDRNEEKESQNNDKRDDDSTSSSLLHNLNLFFFNFCRPYTIIYIFKC